MAYMEGLTVAAGAGRALAPADAFRDAMRELASGVAIVTTAFEGRRAGCAVTSLTSLSLDPPTLLVCLNSTSSTLGLLRSAGVFAVNVLTAQQAPLARRFSSAQVRGEDRFGDSEWRPLQTGAPTLANALVAIDCRLDRIIEHATHAIVIGAAVGLLKSGAAPALLHWRSAFERVG